MNSTIKKMAEHASVRDFKKEALSDEQKSALTLALQSGATSHHVQAFSVIEVTDPELREALFQVSGSGHVKTAASFYVFIADLYREEKMLKDAAEDLSGISNVEALTVAIVDASIAAQNLVIAAESMDLGICYIGGLRNDVAKVAELLNLPDHTYPLYGMCVGVPATRNDRKPRLPLRNVLSENTYDAEEFTDMAEFDATMRDYYMSRNSHQKDTTWTEQMVEYLNHENRVDIADFLKKQGFNL